MGTLELSPESAEYREANFGMPVERALRMAGLSHEGIELPEEGTEAHERLMQAVRNYMEEVFRGIAAPGSASESAIARREYHNQIAMMLLGRPRDELPGKLADKISDFAAYVTGNRDFVGTF